LTFLLLLLLFTFTLFREFHIPDSRDADERVETGTVGRLKVVGSRLKSLHDFSMTVVAVSLSFLSEESSCLGRIAVQVNLAGFIVIIGFRDFGGSLIGCVGGVGG
jgi:hypothetical protein